ncbi:MAG: phage head closure protein [Alphaproteobacteria bacterium]|nr:phage head closure protein [Alphaproteobacteria bacterium]
MKTLGAMRCRIAFQQETQTDDGAGGYACAWETVAQAWASVEPLTGREVYAANRLEGHVSHKITTPWRSDITPTTAMRILYGTRTFNIHAAMNEGERNVFFILLVEEGGA